MPTGAVPFDPLGTDTITDDLLVQPADTENGDYAVLNEDDEIELLLTDANPYVDGDGVDDGAVTTLPHVFTMAYTGDRYAEVWITDDADDVRFYRGEAATDTIESAEHSVRLGPGETIAVGLRVDTRGDHDVEDAEQFTVHAVLADSQGSDDDGDGPRVVTPTTTETATATPTETATETDTASETATATPETATDRPERPTASETATGSTLSPDGGGPTELAGLGPGPLLAVVALLTGLVVALVAVRRYR